MTGKGLGRKRSWSARGTIQEFAWRHWRKLPKTCQHSHCPDLRIFESEHPPNTSAECHRYTLIFSCRPCPSWQSSSFISACHYRANRRDLTEQANSGCKTFDFNVGATGFEPRPEHWLSRFRGFAICSFLPGKFRDSIVSNLETTVFTYILSNSLFTNHPTIWRSVIWATDSIVK
jgi:hypothetical protein